MSQIQINTDQFRAMNTCAPVHCSKAMLHTKGVGGALNCCPEQDMIFIETLFKRRKVIINASYMSDSGLQFVAV